MAATVVLYTNTDAIRGCLGVTDNELLDEMIVDARFDLQLEMDLAEWLPGHALINSAPDAASDTVNTLLAQKDAAQAVLTSSVASLDQAQAALAATNAALLSAEQDVLAHPGDSSYVEARDALLGEQTVRQGLLDAALASRSSAEDALEAASLAHAAAVLARTSARKSQGLLTLYSMWYCAALGAGSMKMAAPRKHTNGKDAFERFTIDLDVVEANAWTNAQKYQGMLNTDQGVIADGTAMVLVARSVPEYDPMTNDGYSE